MRQVSTTITVGVGSEQHNHDLEYRETLEHVHGRENGVIEVIPYEKSYEEQINALMKPFIEEYNKEVDKRYSAAWLRFKSGAVKSKPKKKDYAHMSYDYYQEHKDDTYFNRKTGKNEPLPIFRSLILGLGDRSDRQDGRITEAEAIATLKDVVNQWPDLFPDFKLLGATIHLDESGFYHAHIDYKPLFKAEFDRGLQCSVSQEAALEHMAYAPEQSIINGRDKVPIRFNAFRNHLYRATEVALAKQKIRLQYGVSAVKEPDKDSSRNQALEDWKVTQETARELQERKNVALDILIQDEVSPEAMKDVADQAQQLQQALQEIQDSPKTRLRKGRVITYSLFDQLKSFVTDILAVVAALIQQRDYFQEQFQGQKNEMEVIRKERDDLQKELHDRKDNDSIIAIAKDRSRLQELEKYKRTVCLISPEVDRAASTHSGIGKGKDDGLQF